MGRIRSLWRRLRHHPARVVFETGRGPINGEVMTGQSLLTAARQLQVELDHFCEGQGSCGTCRVELVDPSSVLGPLHPRESLVLGEARIREGDRLACQATVEGPVHVRAPRWF